jgi:hypothetical protein
MLTYPSGTQWTWQNLESGHDFTDELVLYWEANGDPISDDYGPDDASAGQLFGEWQRWLESRDGWSEKWQKPYVDISWSVTTPQHAGTFELAPHQALDWLQGHEDFLSFFTLPEHVDTGERLNWLRLPVLDKLWREGRADKGGFIQEATGWKPSPLQPYVNVDTLRLAS